MRHFESPAFCASMTVVYGVTEGWFKENAARKDGQRWNYRTSSVRAAFLSTTRSGDRAFAGRRGQVSLDRATIACLA